MEWMVRDDYGTLVDIRGEGYDIDKKMYADGRGGLASMDIQSGSVFEPFPGVPDVVPPTPPPSGTLTIHASDESFAIITDDISTLFTGLQVVFTIPAHTYTGFTFHWSGNWQGTTHIVGVPMHMQLGFVATLKGLQTIDLISGNGPFTPAYFPDSNSTTPALLALINAAAGGSLNISTAIDFESATYAGNNAVFTTTALTLTLTY